MRVLASLVLAAFLVAVAPPAWAEAGGAVPQQDFLFVLESAYTQEVGEWQAAIFAGWQRDPAVSHYSVELEYGITDRWQVSGELPFADRGGRSGIGDIELSSAYALLKESADLPELTIAVETTVPSGDGIGAGGWGYGAALRASKAIAPGIYGHAAAAYEWVPNGGAAADELDEWSFGAGIGLQPAHCITLTAELLHERGREVDGAAIERERETYISTGAVFEPADDILVGVAAAFGLGDDSADARLLAKLQAEW